MNTLTQKQRAVLDFIIQHHKDRGFMPSTRDIQRGFSHKSQNAAQSYIEILRRKGYISNSEGKARAYKVLKEL